MNWHAAHAGFVSAAYALALGGLGLLMLGCWIGAMRAARQMTRQDQLAPPDKGL